MASEPYYRARYYDPNTGRFISEDPIGFGGGNNFYAYTGNAPANFGDPLGLQSPGSVLTQLQRLKNWLDGIDSAGQMTYDWATGTGAEQRFFNPGSLEVANMVGAPGVQAARQYFYNKNRDRCRPGFEGVTNYNPSFGPRGLWGAGANSTQQFVGNYRVDIFVNANGTATFVLSNTTSFTSFLYGVGPSWSRDPLNQGWQLPGGNMEQYYAWTESIPNNAGRQCGCKR